MLAIVEAPVAIAPHVSAVPHIAEPPAVHPSVTEPAIRPGMPPLVIVHPTTTTSTQQVTDGPSKEATDAAIIFGGFITLCIVLGLAALVAASR